MIEPSTSKAMDPAERAPGGGDGGAGEARADVRVSVLMGDRVCAGCGYNLTGQPVVRERHYQMLAVRCPECGAVASVQEYPLLGKWASRWGTALAALWFVVLAVAWLISALLLVWLAMGATDVAVRPFATELAEMQYQWHQQQPAKAPAGFTYFERTADTIVDQSWWTGVDPDAVVRNSGGWRGAVTWLFFIVWAAWLLPILAMGCFWATMMAHLRRWRLPLGAAAIGALAAAFVLIGSVFQSPVNMISGWTPIISVARQMIGWPVIWLSLAFGVVALSGAMMVGRPIVRWLVRALLPPRLGSELSLLWIADGLEPPRPTSRK